MFALSLTVHRAMCAVPGAILVLHEQPYFGPFANGKVVIEVSTLGNSTDFTFISASCQCLSILRNTIYYCTLCLCDTQLTCLTHDVCVSAVGPIIGNTTHVIMSLTEGVRYECSAQPGNAFGLGTASKFELFAGCE